MAQTYRHTPDDTMDGYGKRSRSDRRYARRAESNVWREEFSRHMNSMLEGKNNVQD